MMMGDAAAGGDPLITHVRHNTRRERGEGPPSTLGVLGFSERAQQEQNMSSCTNKPCFQATNVELSSTTFMATWSLLWIIIHNEVTPR